MDFLCYHRDRMGSTELRRQMVEEHWSYMDQFDRAMTARGPTFTDDGTLTGSVHIVDLPDASAARAFAFEEPGYQAGAYRDVLLRRWANVLGRTMWDFDGKREGDDYFFVLGFTRRPERAAPVPEPSGDLISFGPLLSDDASRLLGAAALLRDTAAAPAATILDLGRYTGIEVHRWTFGGRRM
jgi:uncharacterized protein YciI